MQLLYQGTSFIVKDGETVLECLLRHEKAIPHSCKSGVCQSCMMQAPKGNVPRNAQNGLKSTLQQQNIFLACQCRPGEDMEVCDADDAGVSVTATLHEREMLNHNVMRVVLKLSAPFQGEPGQYITLINPDNVGRSYSIANQPQNTGEIERHIRLIDGGAMSGWLKDKAQLNEEITVRGPAGNCFYVKSEGNDYPIILAGTGTGLAPLYGIVHEALLQNHKGKVTLLHGALIQDDLYLVKALQELSDTHENFTYVPCVLQGEDEQFYRHGDIKDVLVEHFPDDKSDLRLFLCGAPEIVNILKREAFLGGVASKHIYADAFLPSK